MFTITLSRGYKEKEFREDLKKLYGQLCGKPTVFLFTDAHVLEEGFLELVNNMLTIGMVPALFDEEGKKAMGDSLRDEAKKRGVMETKDDLWNYFLEKAKDNLHVVLAMSPAGDTLRVRCRNFPGLVSNAQIDWFFPWPEEALISVAEYHLKDEDLPEEFRPAITQHIVLVHSSVQEYSREFEAQLKRRNFSTPKNYLDFLSNYRRMLGDNRRKYTEMAQRYENGLKKLIDAAAQVEVLQAELEVKQTEVNAEKTEVETLLEEIREKSQTASKHQVAATQKKGQLDIDNVQIEKQQKEADEILRAAIPLLEEAKQALNEIDVKELVFLKSLNTPAKPVMCVAQCLQILKPMGTEDEKDGWSGAKIMMANPIRLLESLKNYGEQISKVKQSQIDKIHNLMKNPENRLEDIVSVSRAAANLLKWVQSTTTL